MYSSFEKLDLPEDRFDNESGRALVQNALTHKNIDALTILSDLNYHILQDENDVYPILQLCFEYNNFALIACALGQISLPIKKKLLLMSLKNNYQAVIDMYMESEPALVSALCLDWTHEPRSTQRDYYLLKMNRQVVGHPLAPNLPFTEEELNAFKHQSKQVFQYVRVNLTINLGCNHEYVLHVERLWNAVDKMKAYGLTLPDKEKNVVVDLSDELIKQLTHFIVYNKYNVPAAHGFALFEKEFNKQAHSKDAAMSQHRHVWVPILLNIGIALTGVGIIIIAAQLVASKRATGHALFFFEKTNRQVNIDIVQQSMDDLSAQVHRTIV